ncbi:RNA-binding S4 domain-containing protein [Heliomarina baculiformis]|uniref:RNA-binding S4 domain-containing protein n=1 Tax=Heliomarina baculiformis TaxID=2872036 RepID=UPI001EE3755A|nr:RNA-binding S4 domain-containing protein [Heliomarina baculiformis]
MSDASEKLRVDKWLWYARFFKTRSLATKEVGSGNLRLNGTRVTKASQVVSPEDVLTFTQGARVRVVRVVAIGNRRGPAPEAQTLYEDLTEPEERAKPVERVGERPTKKDRRALDAFKQEGGE